MREKGVKKFSPNRYFSSVKMLKTAKNFIEFHPAEIGVIRSKIYENRAEIAGGGISGNPTPITLIDSTVDQNVSGHIPPVPGSTYRAGGGIHGGYLSLVRSTVSNNRTGGQGGGIAFPDTLQIIDSTISSNTADEGGGIIASQGEIVNSTITRNAAAATHTGGLLHRGASSTLVTVRNTIISGNTAPLTPELSGDIISGGHNIIGYATGAIGFTDRVNDDRVGIHYQLAIDPELRDFGGPTLVHAIFPGSLALDAGDDNGVSSMDQRGNPRIVDGDGDGTATVDIGAFEYTSDRSQIIVTSIEDGADANLGDGLAQDASGNSTLRSAIQEVNSGPGGHETVTDIILGPGRYAVTIQGSDENDAATGDLDITNPFASIVFRGAGVDQTIIDATGLNDLSFQVFPGGSATFANLTITGGNGGISNTGTVIVTRSTVLENPGTGVGSHGGLIVTESTIADNGWGGIYSDGGALVTGSTVSENYNVSGVVIGGLATIEGSTISGNFASQAGHSGGGIDNSGTLTVLNSTITANIASGWGGGIYNNGPLLVLGNTILAGNFAGNYGPDGYNEHCELNCTNGEIRSIGHTLIGIANDIDPITYGPGDMVGWVASPLNPLLGPLENNGGPTLTHALLPGSPAIDKGNSFGLATDQRGVFRPVDLPGLLNAAEGDGSDIGAFEIQPTLSIDDVTIDPEGDNGTVNAVFTVTLSVANGGRVEVDFATADATATAGTDYQANSGTLSIDPGELTGTITVEVNGDTLNEIHESFFVNLSSPVNVTLADAQGEGTILDDDFSLLVNSLADEADNTPGNGMVDTDSGLITLRAALMEANARPGDDIITLPAGTYTLSIPGTGEDAAATGDLDVTDNLTIVGAGAGTTIIDAAGLDAVLHLLDVTLSVEGVTVRNGAAANTAWDHNAYGGGILNWEGTLTIVNSIISGNSANSGGGIYNRGTLTIANSTIFRNSTSSHGGGVFNSSGTTNVSNTIIAGNSATASGPDVAGDFVTEGNNLIGNSDDANGFTDGENDDQVGTGSHPIDPILGPLQDNGGPTETRALLPGSPAVDAGDNTDVPATDQRGIPRIIDGDRDGTPSVDIGAFEAPQNRAPTADAGGPYVIDVGEDLVLDGSGSSDPDEGRGDSIVNYEWDLNADGSYEYTGAEVTVPWADLARLPQHDVEIPVRLRVTDRFGITNTMASPLMIGPIGLIGVHRAVGNAGYFIQDPNGNGYWDGGDRFFSFGYYDDTPIIGDRNGDGYDQIGVHRAVGDAGYFIQDYNGNGYWDGGDRFFIFGYDHDTPIIGDWNGDGHDQIGVHRAVGNAGYFIQDYNGNGYWDGGDRFFIFGYGTDTPIIGDWNGDGYDQIGVHRDVGDAGYFIQEYNSNGYRDGGDRFFNFGYDHDTPIIGDWNGDGKDQIGVHRAVGDAGYFIQEYNSNGYWDGGDRFFIFGYGTDTPIIGNWASAAPLMAASESAEIESDLAALTDDAIAPVVQAAINNWSSAVSLTVDQMKTLRELEICVADLPGARLGEAFGTTITLDINAAGHGWFVDTTTGDSARNRIDLLTAVMHELGHVLGFEHREEGLMWETLPLGTRRVLDEIDSALDDDLDNWPNEIGFRAEAVDAVFAKNGQS